MLLLLCAGFSRAGAGYETLPGGPEVGASLLPAEQPGQHGAPSDVMGADRRPGRGQTQAETGDINNIKYTCWHLSMFTDEEKYVRNWN